MNARSFAATRTVARSINAGQFFVNATQFVFGKSLALVRVVLNRRTAGKLHQLSDHQLADIGLTRDDLRSAFAVPFTADPTAELAFCARRNSCL